MTIEECLGVLAGKAAVVRYLSESAVLNPQGPDPAVLAGVSEVCGEIETQLAAVKAALPLKVLDAPIPAVR